MTVLSNHPAAQVGGVGGPRVQPNGSPQPVADFGSVPGSQFVVDGTPMRIVVLAFAAAAGLTALKLGGFRFNIGVSS